MNKFQIFVIFLLTIFYGCDTKLNNKETSNILEIEIKAEDIDSKRPFSTYIDSGELIQLASGTTVPKIGNVDKIEIIDNIIFVLDASMAKTLFLFKLNGEYITTIGKNGEGPGEYIELYDFYFENIGGKKVVYLKSNNKILSYDISGKFLNEKITLLSRQFSKSKNFYTFNGVDNNLVITDTKFKINLNFFPYNSIYTSLTSQTFQKVNEDILYRHSLSDTIYKVNETGIYPFRIVKFENGLSVEDKNEYIKNRLRINSDKMCDIKSYVENDEFIYLLFKYKKLPHMCIYNKKKNTKNIFPCNITNDVSFESYCTAVFGTTKSHFIGLINAPDVNLTSLDYNNKYIKMIADNYRNMDLVNKSYNPTILLIKYK